MKTKGLDDFGDRVREMCRQDYSPRQVRGVSLMWESPGADCGTPPWLLLVTRVTPTVGDHHGNGLLTQTHNH